MAIFANGRFVANDAWRLLGPDEAIAPDGPILVPLARFLAERETIIARGKPFGVVADAGEDVELLAPDLAAISRVVLNFPKYTDGRAYSSARLLRERHGYTGELCAVGRRAARPDPADAAVRLRQLRREARADDPRAGRGPGSRRQRPLPDGGTRRRGSRAQPAAAVAAGLRGVEAARGGVRVGSLGAGKTRRPGRLGGQEDLWGEREAIPQAL